MLEELLEQEQFELLFSERKLEHRLNGNVMRHMKIMRENRAKKDSLARVGKREKSRRYPPCLFDE